MTAPFSLNGIRTIYEPIRSYGADFYVPLWDGFL